MYDRVRCCGCDQGFSAPYITLQESRHRVGFPKIHKYFVDSSTLCSCRGNVERGKELFRMCLCVGNGKRGERIVLRALFRARYLEHEYLLERESFSCSFRLALGFRFVHREERTREVGKVIALANVGRDRVFKPLQYVGRQYSLERVVEPA